MLDISPLRPFTGRKSYHYIMLTVHPIDVEVAFHHRDREALNVFLLGSSCEETFLYPKGRSSHQKGFTQRLCCLAQCPMAIRKPWQNVYIEA